MSIGSRIAADGIPLGRAVPRPRFNRLRATKFMASLVALAQIADVLTTNHVLAARAGAYEANPVTSLLMLHLGTLWWVPKVLIAAVILLGVAALKWTPARLFPVATAVAVLYALVVVNNLINS
jgi:Domain of unknown function (DUF5658)